MLSIRTFASGESSIISRVACRPFMRGRAQSMTTTRGCSSFASLTAVSPSPASPTTSMSFSSSRIRRNPRRTRLWSSTSKTVIFFSIKLRFLPGNVEVHQRSALRGSRKYESPAHQLRTLTHRHQPDPALVRTFLKSDAMIFDFQFERIAQESQPHPGLLRLRMPCNVIQRFLHHAVDVHTRPAIHRKRFALLLIGYGNSRLPFHRGYVPVESALKSGLVEHHRMQRLRKTAHTFQCRLDDLKNFLQVGAQGGSLRRVGSCSAQHRSNGGENLAKLIVQFARNVTQRRFLRGDEFLRQF